ncbi:MAG: hypothetical protein WBF34_10435 [Streptosporangiaceae bacterium]|jgi:hypothetical protein
MTARVRGERQIAVAERQDPVIGAEAARRQVPGRPVYLVIVQRWGRLSTGCPAEAS